MNKLLNVFEKSIDWSKFIPKVYDIKFLKHYKDKLHIDYVLTDKKFLTVEVLELFKDKLKPSYLQNILYRIQSNDLLDTFDEFFKENPNLFLRVDSQHFERYITPENFDSIDFNELSNHVLNSRFIETYINQFDDLSKFTEIPINLNVVDDIEPFIAPNGRLKVRQYHGIDETFVRENLDIVDLKRVIKHVKLSPEYLSYLIENYDINVSDLNMARIPTRFDSDFIKKYQHTLLHSVIGYELTRYNMDTEDILRDCLDVVQWSTVSKFKLLSLDFMKEFRDSIDWNERFEEFMYRNYCLFSNEVYSEELELMIKEFPNEYEHYRETLEEDDDDYEIDFDEIERW